MEILIMDLLKKIFAIVLLSFSPYALFSDGHKNVCNEDDISTLFDLIYGNYLPFEPPLDEEGNMSLSPEEIFMMKSKAFL